MITKEQIEREVKHIFESGANEIRVIELIERLLPRWIPVEEALPETAGFYLVIVDKSVASLKRGCVETSELYETVSIESMKPILKFHDYITHWQPLPTLPEK